MVLLTEKQRDLGHPVFPFLPGKRNPLSSWIEHVAVTSTAPSSKVQWPGRAGLGAAAQPFPGGKSSSGEDEGLGSCSLLVPLPAGDPGALGRPGPASRGKAGRSDCPRHGQVRTGPRKMLGKNMPRLTHLGLPRLCFYSVGLGPVRPKCPEKSCCSQRHCPRHSEVLGLPFWLSCRARQPKKPYQFFVT